MSDGFQRLPDDEGEEARYYRRSSLEVNSYSYDDFRSKTDAASTASLVGRDKYQEEEKPEDNSAPLRKSVRQYSTLVWWMVAMSTAILYGGFDSAVLGTLNAVPAYQRDFGEKWEGPPKKNMSEYNIPAIWLSLWDGIGPLGQIAGAALGGWLLDRMGRRFCLLMGSINGACAILILVLANTPKNKDGKRMMILAGKVLQGFGLGIIKLETFTYMSEVIPVSLKGPVMSLVPVCTLLGQLIGAVVIKICATSEKSSAYQIALGSQWVVALPPLLLSLFLPESPAYLLKKNDLQGAVKSFTRLLGPKNNAVAAAHKLKTTLDEEAKTTAKTSYMECFNAANRRRTLIVIFAGNVEHLFGLSLLSGISYYLQQLGMDSSKSILFLIAGIIIGLLANVGSAWTLSHIARRKLVVTTFLITSGLWTVMGVSGIKPGNFTPWLAGGVSTAVIVVCGLGCWPASYAILGETSAVRLRSKSQGIGSLAGNITNVGMNFFLPMFYNPDAWNLGAKTGFLFTGLSLFGAAVMYFFVPELKGRTAREIDHLFEKGVKSRGSGAWRDTHEEVPLHDA
jgi:SP family general alpha glucoside:H+ symporter-like MFS transporter